MDYKALLITSLTKKQVAAIVAHINENTSLFKELYSLISSNEISAQALLINYKASWVISHCGIQYPHLFTNVVINHLIAPIHNKQQHEGYTRNVIRAFQELDYSNNINANLLNLVFEVACNPKQPSAGRAFAITTLQHIGKYEPHVLRELLLALNHTLAQAPRAVVYRAMLAQKAYELLKL
jgi:hypothetical protein